MSYNGKSIGEVRDFGELKVQERLNVADIFSTKRTYKKLVKWKNSGGKKGGIFQFRVQPRILPIQCCTIVAISGSKILLQLELANLNS